MVRIIHAADFHLDSAFSGLPPEKARQRRRESREILGPPDRPGPGAAGGLGAAGRGPLRRGAGVSGDLGAAAGDPGRPGLPGVHRPRQPRSLYPPEPLRPADLAGERPHLPRRRPGGGGAAGAGVRGPWGGLHRPGADGPGPGGLYGPRRTGSSIFCASTGR